MRPTKKLILVMVLGFLLTGLGAIFYLHKVVFVLYNLSVAWVVFLDYRRSKSNFEITRDYEEKLSLYGEEQMGFWVYNKTNSTLDIRIKDTIPDFHFERMTEEAKGVIPPHEKQRLFYLLQPKKRGIFQLTDVYVAYISSWGLIERHLVYEMKADIKVYPNIKDLRKYRMMVYNGYLMRGGKKVWNRRGEGMEFESLREYVEGDSYSQINWKATASMNKPIVNQYEVEKNQEVISMIDSGRAMSYEVRGYKKLDLAINTALVLSDIANMSGDKSGLMVFNTEVQEYVKPSTGGLHRNKLLEALYTIEYSRSASHFEAAFNYLGHHQKRRSILFVFTEFETLDEASEYIKVLPTISRKHLVILFMMTKEKVIDLTRNVSRGDRDVFLKGAALEILNERKRIIKSLKRSGIMCVECTPETLTTEVINQYIRLKQKKFG